MKAQWPVTALLLFIVGMAARAHPISEETVTKSAWTEGAIVSFPILHCESSPTTRACYTLPVEECEASAESLVRSCLAELDSQIPDKLDEIQSGAASIQVAHCMTAAFDAAHRADVRDTVECREAMAKWQPPKSHAK